MQTPGVAPNCLLLQRVWPKPWLYDCFLSIASLSVLHPAPVFQRELVFRRPRGSKISKQTLLQSMSQQLLLTLGQCAHNGIGRQRYTYPTWLSTGRGWISELRSHPECKSEVVLCREPSEVEQLVLQRCCC